MDDAPDGDRVASTTEPASVDLVERARALQPRSWVGENVRDEIQELLHQARVRRDLEAECATRFIEVADDWYRGDNDAVRRSALGLIGAAQAAELPLWESRGRNHLARVHMAAGEEAQGIEELVTAEVLTDDETEPSGSLAGALNGIAATYMLIDLHEDSARLYDRMASMLGSVDDRWVHRGLIYNRLLNVATWAIALERVGEGGEARERLSHALDEVARAGDIVTGTPLEVDVELVTVLAEVMSGRTSVDQGRTRVDDLLATARGMESECYARFGLATRLVEEGELAEAREQVRSGLDGQLPVKREQVEHALRWLGARIAVLEDADHAGLRETWSYAQLMTQKQWEFRLRRRDAMADRLHIRRLRREHDQVERASLEDPLTGVANRRRIDRERTNLDDATNEGWTTVIYLDVDHFKRVNDTLGHDLGDRALRDLADVLRGSVRVPDLVGRYGGDEFVVVAQHCDPDDAAALGERIITAVREHPWRELHPSLAITISAGIAVTGSDYGRLFAKADEALYSAKQAGRDRAVIGVIERQQAQQLSI
jgi:diguanylate cyclase